MKQTRVPKRTIANYEDGLGSFLYLGSEVLACMTTSEKEVVIAAHLRLQFGQRGLMEDATTLRHIGCEHCGRRR